MKKIATLPAILLFVFVTKSQTKIKQAAAYAIIGKVIDSITQKPLEYATISVFTKGNTKPIRGAAADSKGNFFINNVASGSYRVVVGFVNYSSNTYNAVVSRQNSVANLKTVYLKKKSGLLETVKITGPPPKLIENKIDKIVFYADQDITSQGGVALDLLKKVPMVSVDIDGNVELAGSSGIRFLIDGKPSTAFGNNITDVLQSMPASQVKSIEVITNPSAKYDAQGFGGIINIVLKKNTASGINGNLSLTVGSIIENSAFNFNARKNNFGFNAFINANARRGIQSSNTYNRTSNDAKDSLIESLNQNGNSTFRRHGIEAGLGFDWSYNKKNNFSGNINYNIYADSTEGLYNQSQVVTSYPAGNILSVNNSNNFYNNRSSYHGVDASLDYKRTFNKEGRSLDLAINSSFGKDAYRENNSEFQLPADKLNYGTNNNNPGKESEVEYKVDYEEPVSKNVILNAGGKFTVSDLNTSSKVFVYTNQTGNYLYDTALSNSLQYHQVISAAYAEISFSAGKLFDATIGGRFERTDIRSSYLNLQQPSYKPGYNTFVPSIFFLKNLSEKQTLKLSFTRRIERPEYSDLNPFINTSDPNNVISGNPFLMPEIGNRIELSYNRDFHSKGSFNLTAFYRTSNDNIQSYVVYHPTLKIGDSIYSNVAVSTRENIGLEKNTGLSLFGNINFTKHFSVRLNTFAFYRHTINQLDTNYNSKSFNYRFNINTSYEFTKNFAAEFFGNFNSARHEVQGSYPSFVSYSIALRKQFWKKTGSLAITATNPFNKYTNKQTLLEGPSFKVNALQKVYFRSIGINFTWKFGNLDFKKTKDENPINLGTNDKE